MTTPIGSAFDPIVVSEDEIHENPATPFKNRTPISKASSSKTSGPSSTKSAKTNKTRRILVPEDFKRAPQSTPQKDSTNGINLSTISGSKSKTFSPQSFGKSQNILPRRRVQAYTESEDSFLSDVEPDGGADGLLRVIPSSGNATETPSQRSYPRNQGKSPRYSIGPGSPFLLPLQPQRSKRQRVEEQQSKHNDNERSGFQEHGTQEETWDDVSSNDERSFDEAEPLKETEIGKLEESLTQFQENMQNDHGDTVKWLLHDARTAAANRQPLFIDKVSLFADMKPAHIVSSAGAPSGFVITDMYSYLNKKKSGKTHTHFLTKRIKDSTPRVPKYYSYTTVRRNILSGNDDKLRFIPFLGDMEGSTSKKAAWAKLVREMETAHTEKKAESGRSSEQLAQLREYLNAWLQELDLNIDHKHLILYFLDHDDINIEMEVKEKKMLRNIFDSPLSKDMIQLCGRFSQAFDRVFRHSLKDVIFKDEKLKEMADSSNMSKKPNISSPKTSKDIPMMSTDQSLEPSPERLGTYASLLCLICGAMWCQTHGDYKFDGDDGDNSDTTNSEGISNVDYSYNFRPVIMRYEDLLRKQDVRFSKMVPELDLAQSQEPPCSDQCYLAYDYSDTGYQLKPDDLSKIRGMAITLRDKKRRPCDIGFILNIPCWQVENEISLSEPREIDVASPGGRSKRPEWYDNKRKVLKDYWNEATKAHLHQELGQANPCAHDGPCLSSCPCYNNNVICEDLCGCADDCPRRWTGCSCHASGMLCTTESCICILMNRECGPQCVSCGAIPRVDPINKHYDELFATGCQNVPLQRGVPRKVVMGESQLTGFGLYVAEPVRKGQFLLEYAGEVVSGDEAERRGIIYDRKLLSFLFDLNGEWVVDAARLGNNSRFINHASDEKDGLNCVAKVMLINGEHRIKFIALRDLKVGEELLFDYGRKFAEKHGLSKKLPKAAGGKRGVLTGDEALDALDGLNPANRDTRGKMSAIRGGHGGSRKGRARKTAPTRVMVAKVKQAIENGEKFDDTTQEEDEEEEENDEEEEEDDVVDGREKRKITRPARYSR